MMTNETNHAHAVTPFGLLGYFAARVGRTGSVVKSAAINIEGDEFYQLWNGNIRLSRAGTEAMRQFEPFSEKRMETLRERTDFNALAMDGILKQAQEVLNLEVQKAATKEAGSDGDTNVIHLRPGGGVGD